VDIPLKKGTETDLYISIEVIVPFPEPFFGGYSTEEGFLKRVYTIFSGTCAPFRAS
jgi:hypothetical protein